MIRSMFINNILYKNNILVTTIKRDDPFGVTVFFKEDIGNSQPDAPVIGVKSFLND